MTIVNPVTVRVAIQAAAAIAAALSGGGSRPDAPNKRQREALLGAGFEQLSRRRFVSPTGEVLGARAASRQARAFIRGVSPIPAAEAATVAGPKVSSTRRPPPVINPPVEYNPPPSGPDWNPPPLYPGGTPPLSPSAPWSPPIVGVFDPMTVLGGLGRWNDILTGGIFGGVFGPLPIPKGPTTRVPTGREDPFSRQAQADMRRAEAAQEREIRREERAEERAQVRAEREAERRQAEYERAAGTRRQAEAMAGLEWNPYISPGREMDPRPRQTIGESEAVLSTPPARVTGNPWGKYARAALPFLPLLTATSGGKKRRRRPSDPLTVPQFDAPGGQPLTESYPYSVAYGAFGETPGAVGTNTCECKAPRKKRRKKKRTVCYSGTYTERADGTRKTKKRKVPCK